MKSATEVVSQFTKSHTAQHQPRYLGGGNCGSDGTERTAKNLMDEA
jgi:hypothetical protein